VREYDALGLPGQHRLDRRLRFVLSRLVKFSGRSRDTPLYGGAMLPIIIVRSAILFVWIAANLVGAIRGWDPYPVHSSQSRAFGGLRRAGTMMSHNRQQDIDRKAAENDYRINVKAGLEIELLHEKIDQLREREVLTLTEAVRMLTELLSSRRRVHTSPMRKADGRHNARLSTSWREVISYSPRGIPCFDGTVLIRRTTA
jgi:hypothetical protein